MPKFPTRFSPRRVPGFASSKPSMTHQEDLRPSLVENILRGHGVGVRAGTPLFGDFTATPADFQGAVDLLDRTQAAFDELPSAVRDRFGNDPAALLSFLSDPRNRDEAARLGLLRVTPKGGSSEPLAPPSLEGTRPGDTTQPKPKDENGGESHEQ